MCSIALLSGTACFPVFTSCLLHADLSIVRRHIPGKMLVALNVMWTHLEQQSFPMSEEEYMDKLDTIAYYLRYTTIPPYRARV